MGWRGTIVLALLIAVVGTYVWFDTGWKPTTIRTADGEAPAPAPTPVVPPLITVKPTDVVGIELAHAGKTLAARRDGTIWKGAKKSDAIDDFLKNLNQLGMLMKIPEGVNDLKDYGLQPPHSVVRLLLKGQAAPVILQIGDRNPATTGVYVRLGENGPVVLAGALLVWEFEKAFQALGGSIALG